MNGTLSSSDVAFGSTILAACDPGFMFPDGTLHKYVNCIDDMYDLTNWNDSIPNCTGM